MFLNRVVLAAKRNLRLKCSQCRDLLPAAHFPHFQGTPMHALVCVNCKHMCVVCGVRQGQDRFYDGNTDTCNQCMAKQEVAEENVFFRYPILKYRACPFSVDEMREKLQRERQAADDRSTAATGHRPAPKYRQRGAARSSDW